MIPSYYKRDVATNGIHGLEAIFLHHVYRQGDPLSPFLFIIILECLNVALEYEKEKGLFTGVQLPRNETLISHLIYTDDALFISEWSSSNLKNLTCILNSFHVFGISASNQETSPSANILGCKASTLPFTYLCVSVSANMNPKRNLQPVINKFTANMSKWKSKMLSCDYNGVLYIC
uniref:Reverse transcriptase domain-containing protein n=1 Tax=Lactuca sativa TaxID=4236 RepID=A0A9R1XTW9_LACSA|nr:hypothetical protein LSAT_V11C200057040 [Lactuca sativa]